jgi:hypothetical protein
MTIDLELAAIRQEILATLYNDEPGTVITWIADVADQGWELKVRVAMELHEQGLANGVFRSDNFDLTQTLDGRKYIEVARTARTP